MPPPVLRFAPSSNGFLHLGHAFSALMNFESAQRRKGRFLLRIEDIDATRCRPEFETAIYQDLAWLGVSWEIPVRRQSEHLADYRAALDRLAALGVLYPSFESRAEIAALVKAREVDGAWPRDPDGVPLYPGTAKSLAATERERRLRSGAPFALRLDMEAACRLAGRLTWIERGSGPDGETGEVLARPEVWGDVILARKDIPTSYHLSVVIDDALQGITDVMRGQDLFGSTAVHRLLQKILDLPQPVYNHHDLIRDADGKKLSKSSEAIGLGELRTRGMTPGKVRSFVGLP
jgi:glutamyl-Q tRNA(Asp) synthetase